MRYLRKIKTVLLLLSGALILSCKDHPQADLIIYGGKIYTADSAMTVVEALAVKDGRIIATGTLDSIRRTYRAPQNVDLEGRAMYPGFNDAHCHFYGYSTTLRSVNLVGTRSFEEVLDRVDRFRKKYGASFLYGRGWDQNDWEDKAFPTKEKLDLLYPETPVYLLRIDGHAALANQAALDGAGITDTTFVEGGVIQKRDGRLTGILLDKALSLVKVPELPPDVQAMVLKEAQDSLFKYGLTSVTDAGLDAGQIDVIDSLQRAGDLKVRLNAMVSDDPILLKKYLSAPPEINDRLRIRTFKFYLDGALGSRGALMMEPYSDDPGNFGLQLASREHYFEAALRLREAGWQMAVHAIGDSANRLVLDIYEEVLPGGSGKRWRVEHAQIVHPADIARFGQLGIIPSVQPAHATSDMYWAEERLGAERMQEAYPYQALLKSSGVLALGTDFPVEGINPVQTFYAAIFRQDAEKYPQGGFLPGQALSREEALRGMTLWPAFASFEEDKKGRIAKGMLADFVVLSTDLMTASQDNILKARVEMTFLNGELVYSGSKRP